MLPKNRGNMRELDTDLKRKFKFNLVILRICLIAAVILAILSLLVFLFAWRYPWNISNCIFPEPASEYVTSLAQVLGAISGVIFLYAAFLGQQQQMIIQQHDIRSQNVFNNRTINNQYFFELVNRLTVTKNSLFMTRLETDAQGNHNKVYGDDAFSYYIGVYLQRGSCSIIQEKPSDLKPFFTREQHDGSGFEIMISSPEHLNGENLKFIFDNYEKIWGIESYFKIFKAIVTFIKANKLGDYLPILEGSLSADESLFLFYRIQVDMEDLKDFLTERKFLADIDRNFLLHPDNYYMLYPKE